MPDDAGAPVAAHRGDGGADGLRHREVLMRLGDALAEAGVGFVERDEVAQDLPEPFDVEQAREGEVELVRRDAVRVGLAELHEVALVVDVPRREVVVRRPRRAVLRADAVARDDERAETKSHRELAQVRLQLVVGALDRRVLRGGLLEFDDDERQAVDVEDDVEATLALTAADRHLLHREVRVLRDIAVRHEMDRRALLATLVVDVRDARVAADEDVVQALVLRQRVLRLRREHLGLRLLQVLLGHPGVEVAQLLTQRAVQHDVGPRLALLRTGRQLLAVLRLPLQIGQLVEHELLPIGLTHDRHSHHPFHTLLRIPDGDLARHEQRQQLIAGFREGFVLAHHLLREGDERLHRRVFS